MILISFLIEPRPFSRLPREVSWISVSTTLLFDYKLSKSSITKTKAGGQFCLPDNGRRFIVAISQLGTIA